MQAGGGFLKDLQASEIEGGIVQIIVGDAIHRLADGMTPNERVHPQMGVNVSLVTEMQAALRDQFQHGDHFFAVLLQSSDGSFEGCFQRGSRPDNHIGGGEQRHVGAGGTIQMRVNPFAHQGHHFHAVAADASDGVTNHRGGGDDEPCVRQLCVGGAVQTLIAVVAQQQHGTHTAHRRIGNHKRTLIHCHQLVHRLAHQLAHELHYGLVANDCQ